MQIGVDLKGIHTNFGGRGLSGFRDRISFKFGQISLLDHAYTPILVDVATPVLELPQPSKQPNFPFYQWTIVHGHQKV